jgi:hypothetical protein
MVSATTTLKLVEPEWIRHYLFVSLYLKASPLPPAPLAVAGFMVAGLAAWQYSDRLAGLLDFAVCFLFC